MGNLNQLLYFYLKELIGKLWLFKLSLLTDIALKMNKVRLPCQGKPWSIFVVSDKFSSKKNQYNGKAVSASQQLKDFSVEINGNISKCDFKILYNGISQYLKDQLF